MISGISCRCGSVVIHKGNAISCNLMEETFELNPKSIGIKNISSLVIYQSGTNEFQIRCKQCGEEIVLQCTNKTEVKIPACFSHRHIQFPKLAAIPQSHLQKLHPCIREYFAYKRDFVHSPVCFEFISEQVDVDTNTIDPLSSDDSGYGDMFSSDAPYPINCGSPGA